MKCVAMKIAGLVAALVLLSACDGEIGGGAPLGVASQRDSSAWTTIHVLDFNFDGMQDVLWGKSGPSEAAVWLMAGPELLAPGPVVLGPSGDDWALAYAADFDADGMADLLWTDGAKGEMAVSLMNGSLPLAAGPVIPGPGGDGWTAVFAADFNFDGMGDVLWYNPGTHSMAVWLMAGPELLQPGPVLPTPSGEGWVVSAFADFNLDGMTDVLWNNPDTNTISIWLMNGADLLLPGPLIQGPIGDGWIAVTAADFNADGLQDVLWTKGTDGFMAVWLMSGTEPLELGPVIPGPGAGWKAAAAGDCNGDGMVDALWNNAATNQMAVWLMSDVLLLQPGPEIPGPFDGP